MLRNLVNLILEKIQEIKNKSSLNTNDKNNLIKLYIHLYTVNKILSKINTNTNTRYQLLQPSTQLSKQTYNNSSMSIFKSIDKRKKPPTSLYGKIFGSRKTPNSAIPNSAISNSKRYVL
jgi:hypothetical protein